MESIPISVLTVKQYAKDQNISVQAVYSRIKKGKVKFRKIGSLHLIEA